MEVYRVSCWSQSILVLSSLDLLFFRRFLFDLILFIGGSSEVSSHVFLMTNGGGCPESSADAGAVWEKSLNKQFQLE